MIEYIVDYKFHKAQTSIPRTPFSQVRKGSTLSILRGFAITFCSVSPSL